MDLCTIAEALQPSALLGGYILDLFGLERRILSWPTDWLVHDLRWIPTGVSECCLATNLASDGEHDAVGLLYKDEILQGDTFSSHHNHLILSSSTDQSSHSIKYIQLSRSLNLQP